MAAQSVTVQRHLTRAFRATTAHRSAEFDRLSIPSDSILREILQPRLQVLDEFKVHVSLRTRRPHGVEFPPSSDGGRGNRGDDLRAVRRAGAPAGVEPLASGRERETRCLTTCRMRIA
jgi:hypothetical protein